MKNLHDILRVNSNKLERNIDVFYEQKQDYHHIKLINLKKTKTFKNIFIFYTFVLHFLIIKT